MRPVLCPVLIGRSQEARHIRAALDGARAGQGGTVLLAGDAGIGKSRLAREIIEVARQQGCVVLAGRAVAGGVPTPFRPFAEALAAALRPDGLPEGPELDPFRPALGRLIPQLQSEREAADGSLVFLGEAVLQLMRVLSPAAGCLLVLEDLHWADRETLALVEYVADNLWAERVLLIGTFRPDEGGDASDLAAKLESRGAADLLRLPRLDSGAVADMALACLGAAGLPAAARTFVVDRADGIPFLVEELLAGILSDGGLVERQGRWETTGPIAVGVPATFADAVARRLGTVDADSRRVIRAAAVLGRQFEWSLLGPMVGVSAESVTSALRKGVDLQLIVTAAEGFRFRHALTQEAVLSELLPPERAILAAAALEAVQAAHPGLPGTWCTLAADLAERSGATKQAGELLLEAGRRDLAVGALASAEQTLTRARTLAAPAAPALHTEVGQALTEVYAQSGQVDQAIAMGQWLLARMDPSGPAGRAADLHLMIAQAAIAGGRLADAQASVEIARGVPDADLARVDACAAKVAAGRGDLAEAERLATAALRAAEARGLPEVCCEALEVIGRVARQSDLAAGERAFARAESIAAANGLRLAQLRALHDIAAIDMLRTGRLDRLTQARELASGRGALFLTAVLDLQITTGLLKQFRADEALETARKCTEASRRFHLASLPEALIFQAAAHALRGEQQEMEARISEGIELMPDDADLLGWVWGRCRAMLSLMAEDRAQAWAHMETGAALVLSAPAGSAPPFLGLWPLLGAALGHDAAAAAAKVRAAHLTRHTVIAALLGYADAILAGRAGETQTALEALAQADAELGPLAEWFRQYARRTVAEAALADGWGEPVQWLREAAAYFEARGDDAIASSCRRLMRRAGAPVPRRRPGDVGLPDRLRARGITGREADVLHLVGRGMTNREIATEMYLSPRTVEKHVASLLAKTGLRRRAQLAGYLAELDG